MALNRERIGELCSEIIFSHQEGSLTKQGFIELFSEVVRLSGAPPNHHSVLMGCAGDPSWITELRKALKGSDPSRMAKASEAFWRQREARKTIAAALDAAAAHDDVYLLRRALREADKMPEWELLSKQDRMALGTVVSGLIQAAADMDKALIQSWTP